MTGYRRSEPAFCRGCGIPWSPGADVCGSCGEALVVAATSGGDPYAVIKLKRTMIAAGILIGGGWLLPIAFEEEMLAMAFDNPGAAHSAFMLWLALRVGLCATAVVTARWWYPGKSKWVRPNGLAIAIGVALGVAIPLGLAPLFDLGLPSLIAEVSATGTSVAPLVLLAAVALVAEELFFRGLLFCGVAAFGDKTNAAIASIVLFSLFWLDPVLVPLGIAAAVLRVFGHTVVPAIALRLAALATMVFLAAA